MGVMAPKHYNLKTLAQGYNPIGVLSAFQLLGTTMGDGYQGYLVQDGKYKIITDPTIVAAGDLVFAGSVTGKVLSVVANETIKIQFDTRFIQVFGTAPTDRVIVYNFLTNDATDAEDNKYPNLFNLLGAGFVFLREMDNISGVLSSMAVDANAAAANGVAAITVTVTLKLANGRLHKFAENVNVVSTLAGVVSAVTNNGDGTYTATVVNGTIQSTTISATVNGVAVGAPDTEVIVWS